MTTQNDAQSVPQDQDGGKAAAVGEKAAAVEGMDAMMGTKPRVLTPLERIELPTGASLGRVFARGWKGRRQRIVLNPAEGASYHRVTC